MYLYGGLLLVWNNVVYSVIFVGHWGSFCSPMSMGLPVRCWASLPSPVIWRYWASASGDVACGAYAQRVSRRGYLQDGNSQHFFHFSPAVHSTTGASSFFPLRHPRSVWRPLYQTVMQVKFALCTTLWVIPLKSLTWWCFIAFNRYCGWGQK